jgi:hypothetical protein
MKQKINIINIDNKNYDLDFLIKKFKTNNLELIKQFVINKNDEELKKRQESYIRFSDEIDAQYNLARAIGSISLSCDLYKFGGN